jgi:hypothetical protein
LAEPRDKSLCLCALLYVVCCFSVLFAIYTCTSIFICGTSCLRNAGYFKTGTSIPLQPTRRVFHSTAIQPSSRVRISSFKVIIIIRLFTPSRRHPDPVPGHRELSGRREEEVGFVGFSVFLLFPCRVRMGGSRLNDVGGSRLNLI